MMELTIEGEELLRLKAVAWSRTEPAGRVDRAQMLLAYRENPSFFAVARDLGCIIRPSRGPAGRARRSAAARQGAHDHPRGQGLSGGPGPS